MARFFLHKLNFFGLIKKNSDEFHLHVKFLWTIDMKAIFVIVTTLYNWTNIKLKHVWIHEVTIASHNTLFVRGHKTGVSAKCIQREMYKWRLWSYSLQSQFNYIGSACKEKMKPVLAKNGKDELKVIHVEVRICHRGMLRYFVNKLECWLSPLQIIKLLEK